MPEIMLSFCIPTFDRPKRIDRVIKQILSFKSDEIEIVIGDDNPINSRTIEVMKKYKDTRINYFQNKINLGMDGNMLMVIKKARGKYIFLLMDEDDVEMESIPKIFDIIKSNEDISHICGRIGDKRPGFNKIYFKFKYEDKLFNSRIEALNNFLFYYPHGSGIILRKNSLNLKKAKDYVGFLYMQQALIAQSLLAGNTYSTSKILAYVGADDYQSGQPSFKGSKYYDPLSRLLQSKFKIQIIFDITEYYKHKKLIRRILLLRQKLAIIHYLFLLPKTFKVKLRALYIILQIKISKSPIFWIFIFVNLFFNYIKKESKFKWILEIVNKIYLKRYIVL